MDDNGSICKVMVDGTDFCTFKQTPFDPIWRSHKFNGPGFRYEIAICIQTGWIVWINGPFLCGIPDRNISREWLNYELEDGELYLADGGYRNGQQYSMTPNDSTILTNTLRNWQGPSMRLSMGGSSALAFCSSGSTTMCTSIMRCLGQWQTLCNF